jgi:GNAT superfamily N-acetyltransferase
MSARLTPFPPTLMGIENHRLGNFRIRLLHEGDVDEVMDLRENVLSQLENPDLYVREQPERDFVHAHIGTSAKSGTETGSTGETIGVFDGDRMVAYAMLGLPDPSAPDHLGRYVSQLNAETRDTAANISSCMVLPKYRGHGLQRVLLVARFSLAQAHARGACIAMVSLHNHASRRNMMREGMRIAWVGNICGSQRQILVMHMNEHWRFADDGAQLVHRLNFDRQKALTEQGWIGVGEVEGPDPEQLVFARRHP